MLTHERPETGPWNNGSERRGPAVSGMPRRAGVLLERRHVDGLGALVPGLSVVGNLRALGQRLESAGVDAAVMDEEVLASLVRGDEAEALVVVEPLDGSGGHACL